MYSKYNENKFNENEQQNVCKRRVKNKNEMKLILFSLDGMIIYSNLYQKKNVSSFVGQIAIERDEMIQE